ncbi:acyl-CoA carboxylase subunit beta [Nocardia sp. JMUB6875]
MPLREQVAALRRLVESVRQGSDEHATAWQHAKGKLTAFERIELLLDAGSFTEIQGLRRHRSTAFGLDDRRPYGDGAVCGWGTVEGRLVYVYAQDFRVLGGSLGETHAAKICKTIEMAVAAGAPIVSLNDGAGARIHEGIVALAGYGQIFRRTVAASGVVPQISVMLGPCAGGAAYAPALTDFVFMVAGTSQMFVTGPDVVEVVTGEHVTHDELGGADVHARISGVADFCYEDEDACLADVRYLLSLLPANHTEQPPVYECTDSMNRREPALTELVPQDPRLPFDMRQVIAAIVDDAEYMELHENWAPNILCALARLGGSTIGVVANQPRVLAGVLDIAACDKVARFVQHCDAFNIPLVTLLDVPGFLPGTVQEHGGIIRHGARLLYAYADATVPRIQVITRKAYGGAYIVLDSLSIGADLSYAWPSNEIAVMGAEAASNIIFRKQIASASDPDREREACVKRYQDELMHPYYAVERGLVDDLIDPADTRPVLIRALRALANKRACVPQRKHGNPPA